ncbi:hypothetical protein [Brachybacterium saurashtrense]|uniref:hypothetical protein n=1 Tax=Brachybacterium saurashtrense TaxID=556288 RepID=UPI0019D12F32|nr:hypothetical protein [Brachybacterium saurashtrense]
MRSVSGPRNRLVLVAAAVLALLAAAWTASAALGLAERWPRAEAVLPHGDSTPASLAAAHQQWLLPVAAAASVLVVLLGLWLLLAQVPSRVRTPTLRLRDADGGLLGSLEPAVLERALTEHVEQVAGVVDATVQLSGAVSAPAVQASVTIAEDAETAWAVEAVRGLLADDIRTVLGAEARTVDLLVHLRSASAPSRAVLGGHAESSAAPSASPAGRATHPA